MKIRNCVVLWLSRIVFYLVSIEDKSRFHRNEEFEKKKLNTQLYREFNQICLKENLLPKHK